MNKQTGGVSFVAFIFAVLSVLAIIKTVKLSFIVEEDMLLQGKWNRSVEDDLEILNSTRLEHAVVMKELHDEIEQGKNERAAQDEYIRTRLIEILEERVNESVKEKFIEIGYQYP